MAIINNGGNSGGGGEISKLARRSLWRSNVVASSMASRAAPRNSSGNSTRGSGWRQRDGNQMTAARNIKRSVCAHHSWRQRAQHRALWHASAFRAASVTAAPLARRIARNIDNHARAAQHYWRCRMQ